MRPLIPRVRTGDVLKGTRNLRNYLQTAATLNYIHAYQHALALHSGPVRGRALTYAGSSCQPTKEDRWLVVVNAEGVFGTYCLDYEAVLLFVNPISNRDTRKPGKTGRKSRNLAKPPSPDRMNPTIFSQWFIRTPKRMTNLRYWPNLAYFMWALLQLNLGSIRGYPNIGRIPDGSIGLFSAAQMELDWQQDKIMSKARVWIPRGVTRPNADWQRRLPEQGSGPCLEEIPRMQAQIQAAASNPRFIQHLKSKNKDIYQALSKSSHTLS